MCASARSKTSAAQWFLHGEQRVNDAGGDWDKWSRVDQRFSPRDGRAYGAPFWVRRDLVALCAHPSPEVMRHFVTDDGICYVAHPSSTVPFAEPNAGKLCVAPTASTRTMLTVATTVPFMVKTHLDVEHFRHSRELRSREAEWGVNMTREMRRALPDLEGAGNQFGYLPESLAVTGYLPDDPAMVVREFTPRPYVTDHRWLVPGFSLYSADSNSPKDPPLLIQILEKFGGNDKLGYLLHLVGMMQAMTIWFVEHRGLVLINHGQNTAWELDVHGEPQRAIYRDLQDVRPDAEIRSKLGLTTLDQNAIGSRPGMTRQAELSICFDHYLGTYHLERIVRTYATYYECDFQTVAKMVAQQFRCLAGYIATELPDTTYRYVSGQNRDGETLVVPTYKSPLFR